MKKMKLSRLAINTAAGIVAIAIAAGIAPVAHAAANTTTGAVRIGVVAPINQSSRDKFGNYDIAGGLDYTFQSDLSKRYNFSVDYYEGSHNGRELSVIPITVGEQIIGSSHGQGDRPYYGFGIGAYYEHIKDPGNGSFGDTDTTNKIALGGFLNAGLEFSSNLFVDLRYQIVSPVDSVSADGLEVTGGIRF